MSRCYIFPNAMTLGSNLTLGDTRAVAEALARSKQVELANEASDGNANQERLGRISQLAEIANLQPSLIYGNANR
ncbi:unnamed protein product [Camellia sinensis]